MKLNFYWGKQNEEVSSRLQRQAKKESWIERDHPKNYLHFCSTNNLKSIYVSDRGRSELVHLIQLDLTEQDITNYHICEIDHSLKETKSIESFGHHMDYSVLDSFARSLGQFQTFLYSEFAKQFIEHQSADIHVHFARYIIKLYQSDFGLNRAVEYENLEKTKLIFSSKKLELDDMLETRIMRMHGNMVKNITLEHKGIYELPFGVIGRAINWIYTEK